MPFSMGTFWPFRANTTTPHDSLWSVVSSFGRWRCTRIWKCEGKPARCAPMRRCWTNSWCSRLAGRRTPRTISRPPPCTRRVGITPRPSQCSVAPERRIAWSDSVGHYHVPKLPSSRTVRRTLSALITSSTPSRPMRRWVIIGLCYSYTWPT